MMKYKILPYYESHKKIKDTYIKKFQGINLYEEVKKY